MSIMDLKKNAPKGEFLAYINKKEAAMLKKAGGSGELVNGIPSFRPQDYGQEAASKQAGFDQSDKSNPYSKASQKAQAKENKAISNRHAQRQRDAIKAELAITPFNRNKPLNKFQIFNNQFQKKANIKLAQRRAFQKYQDIEKYADIMDDYGLTAEEIAEKVAENPSYGYDFSDLGLGKEYLGSNIGTSIEKYRANRYDVNPKTSYSMIQAVLNKTRPDTQVTAKNTLQKARDYNTLAGDPNISREKLEALANRGKTPEQINPRDGGNNQPYIPIDYNTGAATTEAVEPYTNDFTYRFGDDQNVIYDDYGTSGYRTTAAEGGIMGTRARRAMGGIMNRIDQRQGYFLGKIVKGVGKAIGSVADAAGKVLKSDVGKMALAGAAFYYGGGGMDVYNKGGGFFSGLGKMGANFMSKSNPLLFTGGNLSLGKLGLASAALPFLMPPAKPNEDIGMGERGGQLIDPLTGKPSNMAEMRENIELAKLEAGNDPDKLDAIDAKYNNMLNLKYHANLPDATPYNLYGSRGYRTTRAATGGRIGYGLGKSVGVFQPTSASMSSENAPSFEGGSGMGGIIADLIKKNPNMFKHSKNSTPINQNNDRMYSKMFNNSQLFNQFSNNNDFIDENMNGIDDREETIMANGGRIGKAEGGLMDLGGMEKDYRAEGGFVPIGEYEKKDDVPARLSVNEFVFTADAVRGAGQGDIDKGAEIMENMMENLENGGTVSEESQGNKGAQNMFKTSERLGALI